ncbi:MAG: MarR family transcriptional regulator [Dehalococcoidia bacterium]|nr:MarR family transcriptional regulator [Dehalococcoidia bacterium]
MSTPAPRPPRSGTPANDARTEAVANRFNSIAIHLVRRLRRADEALGVTPSRLSALSVLVFGGPRTLGELASAEAVTPPTMTRIVAALEAAGLVSRAGDASDRRLVRLEATPEGRRLMQRGRAQRVERLARELRALSADELETLEHAASIFERIEGDRPIG